MTVWDLDEKASNTQEAKAYLQKHGFDRNTHAKFKVGMILEFNTGYNNDIRVRAMLKGINGDDLYIYNDCYWFPIRNEKSRNIKIVKKRDEL